VIAAVALGGWAAAAIAFASAAWSGQRRARLLEGVARASHELRGPLTAARLGFELGARGGELSPNCLRGLGLELERATLALADLSAATAGALTGLRLEELDLGAVAAECVAARRVAAEHGGAELRLEWPDAPTTVLGDRVRLAQMVGNLLANAIEHGGGLVEVCGRIEAGAVRLEVIDGGPGLPAPVAELAARARAGKGWRGRGLAIAASIARDHGGRLAAAPSDRGARVVLELPLHPAGAMSHSSGA
jgi:signal transduction histidine kinase